jgi:hypothetical protein
MSCCGKREIGGGWASGKMVGKEDWVGAGHQEGHWGRADIPVVISLVRHLHCFSVPQHSKLFEMYIYLTYIYIYIYIYIYMYICTYISGMGVPPVFWLLPAG